MDKINILSTQIILPELVEKAAAENIIISSQVFIDIVLEKDAATAAQIQAMAGQECIAVFSSKNAVLAVQQLLPAKPNWQIACIQGATSTLIADVWGAEKIIISANNAQQLAEQLIDLSTTLPIVFFCGDKRLHTIPQTLQSSGIALQEIFVYQTIQTASIISGNFDGIIFMSPSAVESFFSANSIKNNVLLFAIGHTTANAIKHYSSNKILISAEHSQTTLIDLITTYFNDKK